MKEQINARLRISQIGRRRKSSSSAGPVNAYFSTLMRIQSAFEEAGIRFLDNDAGGGIGIRLASRRRRPDGTHN